MIDDPYKVLGLERGASDEESSRPTAAWPKNITRI